MKMISNCIVKFDTAAPIEILRLTLTYGIREKINDGYPLDQEEEDYITKVCTDLGKTGVRVFGYGILFSDVLKEYYLEITGTEDSRIVYAPNKKSAVRYATNLLGKGTAYDDDYEGDLWTLYSLDKVATNM